jgi:multicomponent Na+:H+ antiporter subunit B
MISLILNRIARVVIHIILLFSIFMLFKGHNEPGGGFIAGLMASVSIVLVYIVYDAQTVRKFMPISYPAMIALGLVFAAGTGIGGVILGYPFLTQTFDYFHIPLVGEIELATALSFDIGVFLVVVGATLLIISTLGESSK